MLGEGEIYFSIDVETDGPIPGPHSMLSFAADAWYQDGKIWKSAGCFSVNLDLLPGASPHPDTEDFWKRNEAAYAATREGCRDPREAMANFVVWVDSTSGTRRRPVAVAYPATFDFMFLYWYLIRFAGRSPFGFQALDMKTLAMVALGLLFKGSSKRNFPRRWFSDEPHTHIALDDAKEQAYTFRKILDELAGKR
jgi:hypothetical protein